MAKNDNLHKAKDAKNDEFYTRIHLVNVSLLPKTKGLFLHKLVDQLFP